MEDRTIIKELAKKYSEIASSNAQKKIKERMYNTNDLVSCRPIVLIDEIPWHEINVDDELTCRCENKNLWHMETFFRRNLFQQKYFPCDHFLENVFSVSKIVRSTGTGVNVEEKALITDKKNNIYSHEYINQLKTEEDLEKIKFPVITTDEEADKKNLEWTKEMLGDILPVKLRGVQFYYAPWDDIPRLHGISESLYDMYDNPEFIHKIIKKFTDIELSVMEQYEKLGLLDNDMPLLHCTPAYVSDLPAKDYKGGSYRLKDMWFRSMAQLFSSVSPKMHEEFDLAYSKELFAKCGLVYYGCCEPLDNKMDLLKKIPNLRKVGVSPWSDIEKCASQIGDKYVFARKPNPANVAVKTDPDVISLEIKETMDICIKYGCICEFVLKDISTVSYKLENLITWDKTVKETLDQYF